MEKYAAKCKNQNFMSKLSLKSLFGFLKLGFTSGLSTIFCIWKSSRIEKTWVEGTITFRVIKKKEKKKKSKWKKETHAKHWKYEKSSLFKFFRYKSLPNLQSRFLI